MCSWKEAPAALPPALLQSPESSPFPQLTVPTAGTAPLAACCLSHSPFSSCCQEPPSSSFGFLCCWMALGGVHCRGVHARLKAGRGVVQSQVARAPRWRGSNLEHPGSRPSLLSSWPPSHSPSARDQAGVTALQQPLQPLPALRCAPWYRQPCTPGLKTLAPTPHPLLRHLSPPGWPLLFSLTTFRASPGGHPSSLLYQPPRTLAPCNFLTRSVPSKARSQASAFHLSTSSPPSSLFLLILTFVLPFPCASPLPPTPLL